MCWVAEGQASHELPPQGVHGLIPRGVHYQHLARCLCLDTVLFILEYITFETWNVACGWLCMRMAHGRLPPGCWLLFALF
jgi:hypothetical protein